VSSKTALPLVAIAALLCAAAARAGVISDNRLNQFNGLPGLGRGYSYQSNTLHSVCFESVKADSPVFDFYYEFDKVDADYLRRLSAKDSNWAVDSELVEFLQDHRQKGGGGEVEESSQINIVARITLESYYRTLDESGSPVSKSAKALIEDGRYTAFFDACGFFYVRSLRYSSTFMALFQFSHGATDEEDARFEQMLRTRLFELGSGAAADEVERLSLARGLKIYVRGAGLGRANKLANLVPTSLRELRQSIEAAAELMQAATSGLITSMEVAPWIEHPDVRSYFFSKSQNGQSTFRKTQNLELNSQVITTIEAARTQWLEEYYLSSMCRNNLLEYYPTEKSDFSGQFDVIYDQDRTLFENHRHRSDKDRRITLKQFREYFERVPPRTFLERANQYLNGSPGHEGAEVCVAALLKDGLDAADFTKLPSCVEAMTGTDVHDRFLRNYCLPTPVRREYRKSP
jgi:hypothetical protein